MVPKYPSQSSGKAMQNVCHSVIRQISGDCRTPHNYGTRAPFSFEPQMSLFRSLPLFSSHLPLCSSKAVKNAAARRSDKNFASKHSKYVPGIGTPRHEGSSYLPYPNVVRSLSHVSSLLEYHLADVSTYRTANAPIPEWCADSEFNQTASCSYTCQ